MTGENWPQMVQSGSWDIVHRMSTTSYQMAKVICCEPVFAFNFSKKGYTRPQGLKSASNTNNIGTLKYYSVPLVSNSTLPLTTRPLLSHWHSTPSLSTISPSTPPSGVNCLLTTSNNTTLSNLILHLPLSLRLRSNDIRRCLLHMRVMRLLVVCRHTSDFLIYVAFCEFRDTEPKYN